MKKLMIYGVLAILFFSMIGLAIAESNATGDDSEETNDADEASESDSSTIVISPAIPRNNTYLVSTKTLPSPAAEFCENKGYKAETREDSTGKKYYVCVFPDGKECDQFEFLREKCGREYLEGVPAVVEEEDSMQEIKDKIKSRDCADECKIKVEGKRVSIKDLSTQRRELTTNKISAKTTLNLSLDEVNGKNVLKAYMSNGNWALVKTMPDKASETALENMEAKCAETGCSIELKEISAGFNKTKLAYVVEAEKDSKVLFLFQKKMPISANVDAESGEVLSVSKPWWALIASERQESVESESNETVKNLTV